MWIKHLDFKNKNSLYASNYQKLSDEGWVAGPLRKVPVLTGAWHDSGTEDRAVRRVYENGDMTVNPEANKWRSKFY